jgi:hypothetical protein
MAATQLMLTEPLVQEAASRIEPSRRGKVLAPLLAFVIGLACAMLYSQVPLAHGPEPATELDGNANLPYALQDALNHWQSMVHGIKDGLQANVNNEKVRTHLQEAAGQMADEIKTFSDEISKGDPKEQEDSDRIWHEDDQPPAVRDPAAYIGTA